MSDEVQSSADDVFDVSEIEEMTGGSAAPIFRFDGERFPASSGVRAHKYDFTNPIVLSDADLDKLREMSERFVYYLAGHLSMFLSTEFDLQLEGLSADLYKNFTQSVKVPACVSLFKLQELNGVCLLDVNSHLAVTVVDRLLGGKGSAMPEERGLTDIENALVDDFNNIVVEEWCRQWDEFMELHPSLIGRESSGRFLQTSPPDAMMLTLTMEASFGDVSGPIRIATPYYTIEPLVHMALESEAKDRDEGKSKMARWHESYDSINVPMSAEWDAFEMTVRDLTNLQVGDVIETPMRLLTDTKLRMEGKTCFKGEIGKEGDRVAFRITEVYADGNNLTGKSHE
jgi:flagellar motor switch protein FliM